MKHISARGKQVGLITKSDEVLLWNIGGSLISIERPEIQTSGGSHSSPEAIVFHPLIDGHFFVFYHDRADTGMLLTPPFSSLMYLPKNSKLNIVRIDGVMADCSAQKVFLCRNLSEEPTLPHTTPVSHLSWIQNFTGEKKTWISELCV
jgi:hypothetical protein